YRDYGTNRATLCGARGSKYLQERCPMDAKVIRRRALDKLLGLIDRRWAAALEITTALTALPLASPQSRLPSMYFQSQETI
ncbi:MAG: hypothetical protein P4L50_23415, partial [Anaerolineaceae bacterium]|nr:hypothetical protein [Anaerolineaceae bacterium]